MESRPVEVGRTEKDKYKSQTRFIVRHTAEILPRIEVEERRVKRTLAVCIREQCNHLSSKCTGKVTLQEQCNCTEPNVEMREVYVTEKKLVKYCPKCDKPWVRGKRACIGECMPDGKHDPSHVFSYRTERSRWRCGGWNPRGKGREIPGCGVTGPTYQDVAADCKCEPFRSEAILPFNVPQKYRWSDRLSLIRLTSSVREDSLLPPHVRFANCAGVREAPDLWWRQAMRLVMQAKEGIAPGFTVYQPNRMKLAANAEYLLPRRDGQPRMPIIKDWRDEVRVLFDLANLTADTARRGIVAPLCADRDEALPMLLEHWLLPRYGNAGAIPLWDDITRGEGRQPGPLPSAATAQPIIAEAIGTDDPEEKNTIRALIRNGEPVSYPWFLERLGY